jgi:hypothetical protein
MQTPKKSSYQWMRWCDIKMTVRFITLPGRAQQGSFIPYWQSNKEASSYSNVLSSLKFCNYGKDSPPARTLSLPIAAFFPFVLFANALMNICAVFRCFPLEAEATGREHASQDFQGTALHCAHAPILNCRERNQQSVIFSKNIEMPYMAHNFILFWPTVFLAIAIGHRYCGGQPYGRKLFWRGWHQTTKQHSRSDKT